MQHAFHDRADDALKERLPERLAEDEEVALLFERGLDDAVAHPPSDLHDRPRRDIPRLRVRHGLLQQRLELADGAPTGEK